MAVARVHHAVLCQQLRQLLSAVSCGQATVARVRTAVHATWQVADVANHACHVPPAHTHHATRQERPNSRKPCRASTYASSCRTARSMRASRTLSATGTEGSPAPARAAAAVMAASSRTRMRASLRPLDGYARHTPQAAATPVQCSDAEQLQELQEHRCSAAWRGAAVARDAARLAVCVATANGVSRRFHHNATRAFATTLHTTATARAARI